jgi:hypothetical protein
MIEETDGGGGWSVTSRERERERLFGGIYGLLLSSDI